MSKLNNLSNSETFDTLFNEIADDLAEAINGGNYNCHAQADKSIFDTYDTSRGTGTFSQQASTKALNIWF